MKRTIYLIIGGVQNERNYIEIKSKTATSGYLFTNVSASEDVATYRGEV